MAGVTRMKIVCLAFAIGVVVACTAEQASPPVDAVLLNGHIYTVDEQNPWAEALVIRDGMFAYVGDNAGADAFIADGVEVIDLDGGFVMPGIVDAHTHPGQMDLIQDDVKFTAATRAAFLAELSNYAEQNPGDGWLRACCWPVIAFVAGDSGPDRVELDPIFPDRPVWLSSNAGHSFWLNSAALAELGLDADTPDPRFPIAMYKRDATGRLTGWLKEGAGWQIMDDVFEVDREIHEAGMRNMLQILSEHGVTALYDAGTKEFSDRVYRFLSELERAGELPLRYEGTYRISTPDRLETAIAEMKRFRTRIRRRASAVQYDQTVHGWHPRKSLRRRPRALFRRSGVSEQHDAQPSMNCMTTCYACTRRGSTCMCM